ncbi:hypothetical protein R1flu_000586 [Riccia fluitans]|uniref:Uncharacterized protein n=1 Tax=Riccia fluitans TaxID=41844 RepID=A0ABD1Y0V5_9MARC
MFCGTAHHYRTRSSVIRVSGNYLLSRFRKLLVKFETPYSHWLSHPSATLQYSRGLRDCSDSTSRQHFVHDVLTRMGNNSLEELQRPCYRKIVKVYWFYVKVMPSLNQADFSPAKAKAGIRFYACDFPGCTVDRTWHFKDPLETHMLECHDHNISGERLPNGMANLWEYVPLHPAYFHPVGNRRGEKVFTREILFNLSPSPIQPPKGVTEEEDHRISYEDEEDYKLDDEEVPSDEDDTDEESTSARPVQVPKRKDRQENSREEKVADTTVMKRSRYHLPSQRDTASICNIQWRQPYP